MNNNENRFMVRIIDKQVGDQFPLLGTKKQKTEFVNRLEDKDLSTFRTNVKFAHKSLGDFLKVADKKIKDATEVDENKQGMFYDHKVTERVRRSFDAKAFKELATEEEKKWYKKIMDNNNYFRTTFYKQIN